MKNILLIAPDKISHSMAGPGVRYWNFAVQLSKKFRVTLLTKNEDVPVSSLFEIKYVHSVKELSLFFKTFDVVIVQGLALIEYPILKKINVPLVIDLYDPFILENLANEAGDGEWAWEQYCGDLDILREQLLVGDFFICASEKQKDFWIGMLSALLRINPMTYKEDPTCNKLIGVVPFGLPQEQPIKTSQVVKGIVEGIEKDDRLILWWGGLWNWLDPLTLVRAMEIIVKKKNDIKCLIIGTKHPDPEFIPHEIVKKVIDESTRLGLTNKYIFFKEWVRYEERQNYLLEADIGISLHYNNLETRFSFRTRILDYLWCGLPMIVTKGDVLSDIVASRNLGLITTPENPEELASNILMALSNTDIYKKNIQLIKSEYNWDVVIEDLYHFCCNPRISTDKFKIEKNWQKKSKWKLYMIKGMKLLKKGELKVLYNKMRRVLKGS